MTRAVIAALTVAALAVAAPGVSLAPAAAPSAADCAGPPTAASLPQRPGPALRFGITPGVVAGQVGPPQPAKPDDPVRDLAALRALHPPGAPFVLRLNRFFWSDGEPGIQRFLALARRYTSLGFLVELQLRYQPPAGHAGDIAGWVAWLREVVDRFGPVPGVVGLQVTNEVNFTISPDSSDGANAGAKDALIQGVEAAKDEARRRGYGQLRVGFNWVYRSDPNDDNAFWGYIAQHGGARFLAALDWVGLDAYPGTLYPPAEPPGGYRDGMANALGVLRDCYMPMAGIAPSVPIYVEENGYPTGSGRTEATQEQALREMVGAVNDLRGTFNVSDYRWFNLRDADSAAPNFQQHFGLLRDDYSEKPAFSAYRQMVGAMSARNDQSSAGGSAPAAPGSGRPSQPLLRVVVRDRRGRGLRAACLRPPLTVRVLGAGLRRLAAVRATLDGRGLRRVRGRRFTWRVPSRRLRPGRPHDLQVDASTRPRGNTAQSFGVAVSVRACGARRR